jgi:hypothetical protein
MMLLEPACRKKRRSVLPTSKLPMNRRSRQGVGISGATSHQTEAPRAQSDRFDQKYFERGAAGLAQRIASPRPAFEPIGLGAQERFGLAELQQFLPNRCG